jgi:hypothetical protein
LICSNEIDNKLLSGTYASFADFRADIERVFEICGYYNSVDALIYRDASTMQMAYREAIRTVSFAGGTLALVGPAWLLSSSMERNVNA